MLLQLLIAVAVARPLAASMSLDSPVNLAARDFQPLQVLCKVNGYTLPAVVDTGAQVSIMTSSCAQRCRISPFIDSRYSGKAIGVGSDDVVGEIRNLQVEIGSAVVSPRIAVLRGGSNNRVDFIIGMDLLRKFKSEISLKDNTLRLHAIGKTHVVPFLSKAALATKSSETEDMETDDAERSHGVPATASPTASDLTRARIADAVNQRQQPVRASQSAATAATQRFVRPAHASAVQEFDDQEDDGEEDEDVTDSEAEMVSVEGF